MTTSDNEDAAGERNALPLPDGVGAEREAAVALGRGSPFAYACMRCRRCCRGRAVRINPYEAARLARRLGEDYAGFRDRFTEDREGIVLARDEEEACVFLGPAGCEVHSDRPAICRLHPLGRQRLRDGTERFFLSPSHPEDSDGCFGGDAMVADFLAAQGAGPLLDAVDAYADALARLDGRPVNPPEALLMVDPLDLHMTVSAYCAWKNIPVPEVLEECVPLHAAALLALLGDGEG